MQMAWGYAPTVIIKTAIEHGVFDALDESPKTASELARKARASERGMTATVVA